jgi:hypothetical protein
MEAQILVQGIDYISSGSVPRTGIAG